MTKACSCPASACCPICRLAMACWMSPWRRFSAGQGRVEQARVGDARHGKVMGRWHPGAAALSPGAGSGMGC